MFFLFQLENEVLRAPKAGCFIKGLTPGNCMISPVSTLATVVTKKAVRAQRKIDPFRIDTTFEVIEGI